MIAEAYILFLAFQDKLLSEGHYYIFLKEEQGGPANVLLLYHGVEGQGIASFKAFPGPFWALSRPAPHMEQRTCSKLGKEYIKAVYCHLAFLIYMQNTSCKMPGWMKQKLESRLTGETAIW